MTVLGRGPIFQPVLASLTYTHTCTYNSDAIITLQNILTVQILYYNTQKAMLYITHTAIQYNGIQCNTAQHAHLQNTSKRNRRCTLHTQQYSTMEYNTIQHDTYITLCYTAKATLQCITPSCERDGVNDALEERQRPPNTEPHPSYVISRPIRHRDVASGIQCNTTQYNTIQYNTIQYNTIQYNTIQYNTIQHNAIQHNAKQYNTIQYNTIQYNTTQHNTTQHSTIQYNTTQYNTIQYNTV